MKRCQAPASMGNALITRAAIDVNAILDLPSPKMVVLAWVYIPIIVAYHFGIKLAYFAFLLRTGIPGMLVFGLGLRYVDLDINHKPPQGQSYGKWCVMLYIR